MITPEEVMKELQYYITEFGIDYFIEIKNGKHFPVTTAYLSQQKKKDELLGLYRECNKEGVFWLEIQQRIAQLEKELEELK